jgi:signal transduction histidine kinase
MGSDPSGALRRARAVVAAHPRRVDVAVACLLCAFSLAQVLGFHRIAAWPVGTLIALGSTLPIAFARTRPVEAAAATCAAWMIPADGYVYVGYVAAFLLFYLVAAHEPDGRRLLVAVALGCIATVVGSVQQHAHLGEYFGAFSAVIGPAIAGRVIRHVRLQAERLRELTWRLDRERERSAHAAVGEERARIARELHDVVAHGLSVIAIQADAAEAALASDPARAARPLTTIRGSAREALGEMRRLLGVLREDDDAGALQPQPGLAQLPALLDSARAAGLAIHLTERGEPRELHGSLDLSAYRIVQEALTNVRRHAPGAAADLLLDWGADRLAITVGNGGTVRAQDGTGHGLVGMRERARIHGGELHAGPAPDGGFEVRAVLPYG